MFFLIKSLYVQMSFHPEPAYLCLSYFVFKIIMLAFIFLFWVGGNKALFAKEMEGNVSNSP